MPPESSFRNLEPSGASLSRYDEPTGESAPPALQPPGVHLALAIVARRRTIVILGLIGLAIGAVRGLTKPPQYESQASFMPQQRSAASQLSGLAAQFGIATNAADPTESPAFYASLLRSRGIIDSAVVSTYAGNGSLPPRTLIQWYGIRTPRPDVAIQAAAKRLLAGVSVQLVPQAGIVRLLVRAPQPALAQQITAQLLALTGRFNVETRRSQAAAERQFTEHRLAEIKSSLDSAEDRLTRFREENAIAASPALRLQDERLTRAVASQEQIYNVMLESYERAKIDEVRDTPVFTVVESPSLPMGPATYGPIMQGIAGAFIGLLMGLFFVTIAVAAAGLRQSRSPEARELYAQMAGIAGDLRRPWRMFRARK